MIQLFMTTIFLTKIFNNYNGINLIGFNKQNFEYKQNYGNVIFKINHPYIFHFKKINFNYNVAELLFHSKLFCDDFLGYDVSELNEIKEAIIDILFDNNNSIIPLSHNMFENMLGYKNNVKLTKELKAYFKKANLLA